MQFDSSGLSRFYETAMGQVMRRLVQDRLRRVWPDVNSQRVLGFGFATPYLRSWLGEAERVVALMPARAGVVIWPEGRTLSALGEEDMFPFPDAMFDRVLIVHGLENAESGRALMRQVWRVMAPEGRLLLVAPNRTSAWSQLERSPFAYGRPFTRSQLVNLLHDCMFTPEDWDCALLLPPFKSRRLIGTGKGWERLGRRLWPRLAGVHIVEATKSLYIQPPPLRARDAKRAYARKPV